MNIDEIKIQKPLFYNNKFALRFEIGDTNIPISANKIYNKKYFFEALKRAISIFEATFSKGDNITFVCQNYAFKKSGRIRKNGFLLKQIKSSNIVFTKHRDIYMDDLLSCKNCYYRRATISKLNLQQICYKNILKSIINQDFIDKSPSTSQECYFVNNSKNLILNLYDDRGIDVMATKKETLQSLYKTYNSWILNYDRKRVDETFA